MLCLPGAGVGHANVDPQPPPPVPTQMVTPASSVVSIVVDGWHCVGGRSGMHLSPSMCVPGPHCEFDAVMSAGSQVPLRSIVPSAQSSDLQPLATSRLVRM